VFQFIVDPIFHFFILFQPKQYKNLLFLLHQFLKIFIFSLKNINFFRKDAKMVSKREKT